ncbi:MAG TPA: hypothetical protein VIJ19_08890 [Opitutaceae bacterium]
MNSNELDRMLGKAAVPERSDAYWGSFPGRVVRRIETAGAPPARTRLWQLGFASAFAACCGLVIGFVLWHRNARELDDYAAMRDGRTLRALEDQYPGRLQSIIRDASGLHTQLSGDAAPARSDPVWLEIEDGGDRRVVVTYSGQLVRCRGKDVMVLSDAGGQVILVGDGFLWSRQATSGLGNALRIQAEDISYSRAHQARSPQL